MGLLDGLQPPKKIYPCKVRSILENLEEKDAQILLDAINSSDWEVVALSNALRGRGLDLSTTPIAKHRKKLCSCGEINA